MWFLCFLVSKISNNTASARLNLKAHNHLFGQFLNILIYITNKTYTPNINLTNFEPLKPSRSRDISLLVFKISKEAVKQPCLDQKYNVYSQNTHTSCVYLDIKFSGLSPIYPNVSLRS